MRQWRSNERNARPVYLQQLLVSQNSRVGAAYRSASLDCLPSCYARSREARSCGCRARELAMMVCVPFFPLAGEECSDAVVHAQMLLEWTTKPKHTRHASQAVNVIGLQRGRTAA